MNPSPPVESTAGLFQRILNWIRRMLEIVFGSTNDSRFLSDILEAAARQLSETLAADRQAVDMAIKDCREGRANEFARKLHLRIDCTIKKLSAARAAVTISIALTKDSRPILARVHREVSWDELPREIRSEFIRNNPAELCYVIAEQPDGGGGRQITGKQI
ncbi:MAG: hypothetical protein ABSA47_18105 [Verrucomicrobiota bacterium]|jgi:hypothetical protein